MARDAATDTATIEVSVVEGIDRIAREDWNAVAAEFPGVLAHLYQLALHREQDLERFLAEDVIEADDYLI